MIAVVLLTLAALLWQSSTALACGVVVSRGGLVEADAFTAMISHDGITEHIAIRLTYGNVTEDFGWILPVPAVPTLTAADLSGFARAASLTAPPEPPMSGLCPGCAGAPAPGAVEELSRSVIGDLEFVVLRATGTGALSEWMAANGFAFHYGQAEALQRYLERGWVVIAARLAQQTAAVRRAASVRVSFATPTLVYPLGAGAATHPGSLRTTFYTLTPWRPAAREIPEVVVRPRTDRSFPVPGARLELRYSAPLDPADAASISRTVPVPPGAWLTRYDSTWDLLTIDRDLVLVRASDQSAVNFASLSEEGGPGGWIVALTIAIAALAVVAWRTRRAPWSAAAPLVLVRRGGTLVINVALFVVAVGAILGVVPELADVPAALFLAIVLWAALVDLLPTAFTGATVGHHVMRLRIRRIDGATPTTVDATLRSLGALAVGVGAVAVAALPAALGSPAVVSVIGVVLLPVLPIVVRNDGRGWHELISHTRTVPLGPRGDGAVETL